MAQRISYDKEANMGYINVVKNIKNGMIDMTDELDVNPFISLDLNNDERIVGLELAGNEAKNLESIINNEIMYTKNGNSYSLRINNKEAVIKYSYLGIDFYFAKTNYTELIGFDINDISIYKEGTL